MRKGVLLLKPGKQVRKSNNLVKIVNMKKYFVFIMIFLGSFFTVLGASMGVLKLYAGDFTKSVLADVLIKMDNMWTDNMIKPDFEANVEVVKAVMAEQTAKVTELEDPEKDRDVKIHWIKPVTTTPGDIADQCTIGGAELESDNKTYALGYAKTTGFSVTEEVHRTNMLGMTDVIAKGFLMRMKDLDELVAQTLIAKIEAYKGTNQVTGGKGTVVGTETYIDPTSWDANLFAYLIRVGILNRFSNPFILSGSNLYDQEFNAIMEALNANGKGDAAKFKAMRKYFDLFNIDTVNTPDLKTYLINRGALAMAFKSRFKGKMVEYTHGADQKRFSIPSRNLPGVVYDVRYNNECTANDIKHNWSFDTRFDIFNNPTSVAARTGVLSFINGEVPA